MTVYGQRVSDLLRVRLQRHLGPDAVANAEAYEADLARIAERVETVFADREQPKARMDVLYIGLIASFGGLARTWCNHGTLATAHQNAYMFATELRRLLDELIALRQSGESA
ncbi:MAG TPA: hypothetical protein VJM32_05595 [Candidatus Saccharimonadales bacterium]|nr:hypothetical protein [Candidatus Saccharimonadales bacterium]